MNLSSILKSITSSFTRKRRNRHNKTKKRVRFHGGYVVDKSSVSVDTSVEEPEELPKKTKKENTKSLK